MAIRTANTGGTPAADTSDDAPLNIAIGPKHGDSTLGDGAGGRGDGDGDEGDADGSEGGGGGSAVCPNDRGIDDGASGIERDERRVWPDGIALALACHDLIVRSLAVGQRDKVARSAIVGVPLADRVLKCQGFPIRAHVAKVDGGGIGDEAGEFSIVVESGRVAKEKDLLAVDYSSLAAVTAESGCGRQTLEIGIIGRIELCWISAMVTRAVQRWNSLRDSPSLPTWSCSL